MAAGAAAAGHQEAVGVLSRASPCVSTTAWPSTVAAMVKAGQVDFGISSQTYGDRELTSQVLMMDRLCAVVALDASAGEEAQHDAAASWRGIR